MYITRPDEMRSILNISSISLSNVRVKEEHFGSLVCYISLLLTTLRRLFLIKKFSRILIMKLVYLLDREALYSLGITVTKMLYINYFQGPYNPSVIDALEHLVDIGVLVHGAATYEYKIASIKDISNLAKEAKDALLNGCRKLGIDYVNFRGIALRTIRKTVELDSRGLLVAYVHSLPEVRQTPFGKVILLKMR